MKHVSLLIFGFIVAIVSFGQPICGFDELHQYYLKNNPEYAKQVQYNDAFIRDRIIKDLSNPNFRSLSGNGIDTIPVVVHVVHSGGEIGTIYNPSDETIIAAVNYMNTVYSASEPWVGQVQGVDIQGAAKDINIRFVLAKRDPLCNPTNGIVRVDASSLPEYVLNGIQKPSSQASKGVPELDIKNLSRWPTNAYYNIWVVNKIDGADGTSGQFTAGYAYIPELPGFSAQRDGTVILATSCKENDKTLTHELGHGLNLYHPFEGLIQSSTLCPVNNNCLIDGDKVCDTDPIPYVADGGQDCRTSANPCTNQAYSPLTEYNFMSYSRCFTLFTQGQRQRMVNVMALPSRKSLADSKGSLPPSLADGCQNKVNFTSSFSSLTESTQTPTTCAGYKDYTFGMSIVGAPTTPATVTLIPGGTATNGVDYEIFTNGNLSVPSLTINFPIGSGGNQTFVVRVKDDANVEPTELLTLGFNITGGALKGEGTPVLTIQIKDNDLMPSAPGSVFLELPIGAPTSSSATGATPFRGEYSRSRLQAIYKSDELFAAGLKVGDRISSLSLFVQNKVSTNPFNNFTINLTNTPNSFVSGSGYITADATPEFVRSISTSTGENKFDLDPSKPFLWNGQNLLVQFCFQNSSGVISASDQVAAQFASQEFLSCFSENTPGGLCSMSPSFLSPGRPFIKLYSPVKGNAVDSTISSNNVEYLGPNEDVYFFDADNNILARIKNLTAHDYGCTTVEIDRAGTTTKPFWYNNNTNNLTDKTFKVIPQNPNPIGSYEISLYYTNAEVAGYTSQTGQSWSTVQMVKSAGVISSITPINQQGSTVTVNTATSAAYGSVGQVVTASFNNGFSGFAVGRPGTLTSVFDNQILKGVKVFPNPMGKQINISFEKIQRNVSVRMMSIDGRILYSQQINGTVLNHSMMTERLNPGIYLLEINSDEGKKMIPLIKQ